MRVEGEASGRGECPGVVGEGGAVVEVEDEGAGLDRVRMTGVFCACGTGGLWLGAAAVARVGTRTGLISRAVDHRGDA